MELFWSNISCKKKFFWPFEAVDIKYVCWKQIKWSCNIDEEIKNWFIFLCIEYLSWEGSRIFSCFYWSRDRKKLNIWHVRKIVEKWCCSKMLRIIKNHCEGSFIKIIISNKFFSNQKQLFQTSLHLHKNRVLDFKGQSNKSFLCQIKSNNNFKNLFHKYHWVNLRMKKLKRSF